MFEISGVRKAFGDHQVLKGVDFTMRPGQVTALMARNGAGKSTLISILVGRLRANAGTVRWNGETVLEEGRPASRERALRLLRGLAAQDTGVYPELSVHENLSFAGGWYGLRGRTLRAGVDAVIARLGLDECASKKSRTLSGGQKRRLHMGMALVHRPGLVLLDEPTVGSDPEARRYILNAVRELTAEGATVLYTSHYFPEIEELEADIAFLVDGRIEQQGSYAEITGGANKGKSLEEIYFGMQRSVSGDASSLAGVS